MKQTNYFKSTHYRLIPEDDYCCAETKKEALAIFQQVYKRKILPESVEEFEMWGFRKEKGLK